MNAHSISSCSSKILRGWANGLVTTGLLFAQTSLLESATIEVEVIGIQQRYSPDPVIIRPGDTVRWTWVSTPEFCSVTSGTPQTGPTGLFDSGQRKPPHVFSHTFATAGQYDYFCSRDPSGGMTGSVQVVGSRPLNISTRLGVQTGENVMIGGFIITGNVLKDVIVRAIGPSLQQAGLSGVLADPVLELRRSDGSLVRSNDNWKDSQPSEVQNTGIPPQSDFESAIVATLAPGSYTAIVSGKNASSGVGLVEVYDLSQPSLASLANISTRGYVESGNNVMIGGFIIGNSTEAVTLIVRGLGPSLAQAGIDGALGDPLLELRDGNGGLVRSNNNWRESQETEIQSTGIPPHHNLEAAIVAQLVPGSYTAIVSGNGGGSGVGLVEVYHLQ